MCVPNHSSPVKAIQKSRRQEIEWCPWSCIVSYCGWVKGSKVICNRGEHFRVEARLVVMRTASYRDQCMNFEEGRSSASEEMTSYDRNLIIEVAALK
ncbi:hypothetical protein H671_3g8888 [Cricetulus griseus]|nr:hypothetical protein H671_3g8888 [Cricetulus griseus]